MPMPIAWDPEWEAAAFIKYKVEQALGSDVSGCFFGVIPQEAGLPAVRMSFFMRRNEMFNSTYITMSRLRGQVLAIVPDVGGGTAQDLSQRIAAALHQASGTAPGSVANVIACTYLEPLTMTEIDRGQTVRHAGGIYELLLQVAP